MHKSLRVVFVVLVVLLLILLPACTTSATEAPPEPAVEEPAPDTDVEEAAPAGEVDTEDVVEEAPAEEGYDAEAAAALVEERCTDCHGLSTVTNASYTEEEWASTVARMIGLGADLNDQEAELVIQYLADNYGP